ncbi:MAG: cytochrome c3 family protein [Candidatus Acidiferrales bacterium]
MSRILASLFLLGGVALFAGLIVLSPMAAGQTAAKSSAAAKPLVPANPSPHPAPEQPLPYSHKTHLALGLVCNTCHTNPDPGVLMTFPPTSRCMRCHADIATDRPSIQKLTEYSKSDTTIPWVRVYTVLKGVNWNHRAHLQAGIKCETCHGQVSQMAKMSEATSVTTMSVCLGCHTAEKAPTACNTCHSWPAGPYMPATHPAKVQLSDPHAAMTESALRQ